MDNITFPTSAATVTVRIIDTTTYMKCPASIFVDTRPYPNLETLEFPSYAFLIEHRDNHGTDGRVRRYLFDLGLRKDWRNGVPGAVRSLERFVAMYGPDTIGVRKDVRQILEEDGEIGADQIDGILWSHFHFDHTGDVTRFPSSVELVVGPGFKKAFVPGFPSNPKSPVLERDYQGRKLRGIEFDSKHTSTVIGGMPAFDFFGDGSFYLLDAPGHTIGHLCGLARTTVGPSPTFIFMGADCCHHPGEFRPSRFKPLPDLVADPSNQGPAPTKPIFCPGQYFVDLHAKHSSTEPFYNIKLDDKGRGLNHDPHLAMETAGKIQRFDAHPDVFVVIAHDDTLEGVVDFFPRDANTWKEKDWAEKVRWRFLGTIPGVKDRRGKRSLI